MLSTVFHNEFSTLTTKCRIYFHVSELHYVEKVEKSFINGSYMLETNEKVFHFTVENYGENHYKSWKIGDILSKVQYFVKPIFFSSEIT